ncbi:ferritin [Peptoniphilus equinus]|uniref:Ferritin n=1 Tax=Peptoniphilus equinus TaxID=3016343 RepID=A0ABY7QV20_9FIRM|nr:ferritin [Peptoniphilus equinus]WBW49753.1 ferritin [Peptoniphilus equinus]
MENLVQGLNTQFNFEIESAYIYLAMSSYCKAQGMDGFAHFMYHQAKEEMEHAHKFYEFLHDTDNEPTLEAIAKPEVNGGAFINIFQQAYEHEQEVTRRIRELYKKAQDDDNFETLEFLGWFIKEQVEEEDNFRGILERLERIGESWSGLYIYDRELGQR